MKNGKWMITALLLTIVSVSQAQDHQKLTAEQRAQKWTDWMQSELGLSAEQVSAAHAINLKYAHEVDDVRESGKDRREKLKEGKALTDAKDNELQNVFTVEQFKIYQERKDEMRKKMVQRARQRRN